MSDKATHDHLVCDRTKESGNATCSVEKTGEPGHTW